MTFSKQIERMDRIPMWLIKTVISILLTCAVTWVTWASVSSWKHEVRLGVQESKTSQVEKDIKEIKDEQKAIHQEIKDSNKEVTSRLDRLIDRRPR